MADLSLSALCGIKCPLLKGVQMTPKAAHTYSGVLSIDGVYYEELESQPQSWGSINRTMRKEIHCQYVASGKTVRRASVCTYNWGMTNVHIYSLK